MEHVTDSLSIKTNKRVEIVDITRDLNKLIQANNFNNGLINVFSRHSTSAIAINENESGLVKDFQNKLESFIPTGSNYQHDRIDNNADSHIRAFFIGSSESIPFKNGSMNLGTWQSVFFIELDGPRNRSVIVTLIGEK
ncbi:MAG: secondary thiamine-phosphate synthase enzyme YjbQ [Methanobacteriaceae archaeon]